ncbi:PEP-CTERM sorting domain-containing protein [Paraglaciecola chathamensis]|jgi:hypothetical protein|uniref:Ice-binding protein C-terminal domain-containing protein n=1 Tax=Paraglaciecola agarilytica NO2 TaxID=1125747 RepID=A0ABQ0ID52_9ALTE|nr:PEP-CTERM sorting domain-containing protein [Paraglaciecola agarilytica]GAC07328.1 hypothetical protein GAGA_4503 [Paraglaciecola agarilytica NO2]
MKNKFLKGLVASFALAFVGIANAGLIIGAVDIDASSPEVSVDYSSLDAIIDQSGLSNSYISGVTDFSSFVGATTASYDFSDPEELGGVLGLGSIYFDLGDIFNVDSIAIWGQNGTATLTSYALYASDTFGSSGTRTLIGNFLASSGPNAVSHNFISVNTQYLEIDVLANQGYSSTRVNEIAFGGNHISVPEPSTLAIFALGLMGLASRKIKKQA